jgi:mxaJ protein
VPLAVTPIPSKPGDLPFAFNMAMGVKKGNDALFARVQQALARHRADIDRILNDFNLPLLERKASSAK